MSYADDKRLLVEIAHMYYDDGAKQEEVAAKFNISRSLVSKYLSRAKSLGLVEIIVHDEQLHPYRDLENKLKRLFSLREVICVQSVDSGEQLKKRIASAASKYFARMIKQDSLVGVSAGTTVQEVAQCFSPALQLPKATFVPMVGGLGIQHTDIQANVICDIFAKQCGGIQQGLHAPIMVDSKEARKVFMEQSFIKEVFNKAKKADIALVGIGGLPVYSTMTKAYMSNFSIQEFDLNLPEIVGDICYNFIDDNGETIDCEWNKHVLNIGIEELKKIPTVIGVAGGKDKLRAIHSALKGQLINVLITDADTVKAILE